MKIIDASEVSVGRKTSKIDIKKISKTPIKIINKIDKQNVIENAVGNAVENVVEIAVSNDAKPSDNNNDKLPQNDAGRVIRAIKLKEEIYYGPKKINKNRFMRMYKKLGFTWIEDTAIDGKIVSGWFNQDRSQYIIKLLEDGDFKRFIFHGCDEIYDYFTGLGAITFDHTKENSISPSYQNSQITNYNSGNTNTSIGSTNIGNTGTNVGSTNCAVEDDEFIGADLWSGYRTRQLLKDMPDNWGVIWK